MSAERGVSSHVVFVLLIGLGAAAPVSALSDADPPAFRGAAAMGIPGAVPPGALPLAEDVGVAAGVETVFCNAFGLAAAPFLLPLSLGDYEAGDWGRDTRFCRAVFSNLLMGVGSAVIGNTGFPEYGKRVGAGSFDRFFRDVFRSRDDTSNFFDGTMGAVLHPVLASALLLGTTATGIAGEGAYLDSVTRGLPLLWTGLAANSLPTVMAKRSLGRERPFVLFDNEEAIEAFGEEEGRESFYSGHTSTAFFSATFVDRVLAHTLRQAHPGYCLTCPEASWKTRVTRSLQAGAMYGLAAAVGWSRMDIDKHFMTDVAAGAAMGALHGELTYRLGYGETDDGSEVRISPSPRGYGLMIEWRF